jgi:hypothetical protein
MAHKLNGKKLKLCLYIATMTHNTKSRASRAIHPKNSGGNSNNQLFVY